MPQPPQKIAIIGSGCSGIGAVWALQSTDHEVHLFEKAPRLGGHTNTCLFKSPLTGAVTPVDTGFIVMNTATYPNLIRFLEHVRVPTAPTEMTFGVSRDAGLFEWSGNAEGVFAQTRNIFSARHWRMIFDIVRFNEFALDLLREEDQADGTRHSMTIGAYLRDQRYSQAFTDDYLIPMTAAVWSTSPDKASLEFPAVTLVRFMWNHHLLSTIASRPLWLTIPGGSQKYIDAVLARADPKRFTLHLDRGVEQVQRRSNGKVDIVHRSASSPTLETASFDHVIFACHGDEILPLLSPSNSATEEEQAVLSAFQTTRNKAYLHSDLSLMPRRRRVWTAWNYLTTSAASKLHHPAGVSLTYWMNILQHIPESAFGPVLVTLNPLHAPDPRTVQGEYGYTHPLYTPAAVEAQRELRGMQGRNGLSYAGAWTGYGFHEDGFSSGLKVALEQFGAELPFEFVDSTFSRGRRPPLDARDRVVRAMLGLALWAVLLGEWVAGFEVVARVLGVVAAGVDRFVERLEGDGDGEQKRKKLA